MTRQYARVRLQIWSDGDFLQLSERAQALYFKLLTHPTLNLCGVADWRPKRLAAITRGQTVRQVEEAGRELEEALYIITDSRTEEVLIRSFLRNDEALKNPKVGVSVANSYAEVVSPTLRGVLVHELKRLREDHPDWGGFRMVENLLSEPEIDPIQTVKDYQSDTQSMDYQPLYQSDTQSISSTVKHNLQPTTINPRFSTKIENQRFDEWYSVYPKKADKQSARRAFIKALKLVPFQTLLDGAARYRDDPNREPQFTKNPATWLNAGAWDNQQEAARSSSYVNKAQQRYERNMARVHQAELAEQTGQRQIGGSDNDFGF